MRVKEKANKKKSLYKESRIRMKLNFSRVKLEKRRKGNTACIVMENVTLRTQYPPQLSITSKDRLVSVYAEQKTNA